MATVNFLFRSTKEKANLNIRLLFRYNSEDYVFGGKTKIHVSKDYWFKKHFQKRVKDIEIANKQTEINTEINKLENHILQEFSKVNPESITKQWLKQRICGLKDFLNFSAMISF